MIFVDILLPIFLLVGAGALFSRVFHPELESLTLFSLYAATPALVFEALVTHPFPAAEVGRMLLLMAVYSAALWALSEAAARVLKLSPPTRRAFALAVVPMNVGNYGLPLVRFAFGPDAVPFSILVFVVFNLPLATWAIWIAAGGGAATRESLRQTLRIPIFHATIAAFAVNAFGWHPPAPVMKALGLLGEASIPLLMVILGMQLERIRVLRLDASYAAAGLLRLAVAPALAWALTGAIGYVGRDRAIAVLQTSTPAAVLPLLYALRFDCRPDWISANLLLTTLVSGASLSVLLYLLT